MRVIRFHHPKAARAAVPRGSPSPRCGGGRHENRRSSSAAVVDAMKIGKISETERQRGGRVCTFFGYYYYYYICLIISLRGSLEIFDTLYPLQERIFLSHASLLALLAHRAYYLPAHCGVTCCSCFVQPLPLPAISSTSKVRVPVFLLGFTT